MGINLLYGNVKVVIFRFLEFGIFLYLLILLILLCLLVLLCLLGLLGLLGLCKNKNPLSKNHQNTKQYNLFHFILLETSGLQPSLDRCLETSGLQPSLDRCLETSGHWPSLDSAVTSFKSIIFLARTDKRFFIIDLLYCSKVQPSWRVYVYLPALFPVDT